MRKDNRNGLIIFTVVTLSIIGLGIISRQSDGTNRARTTTPHAPPAPPAAASERTPLPIIKKGERAPWPQIPFNLPPYGSVPESIPVMQKLNIDFSKPIQTGGHEQRLLEERLVVLVQQNIDPLVATELDPLMRAHKIWYNLDPTMHGLASFYTKHGQPYFGFNSESVANMQTRSDVAGYMLVIAHEYVHYKQWKRATDPVLKMTFETEADLPMDERVCTFLWHGEREAYMHQCKLGLSIGLEFKVVLTDPQTYFCRRIQSDRAFDQALYYALTHREQKARLEQCADIWWDLAGGPRN